MTAETLLTLMERVGTVAPSAPLDRPDRAAARIIRTYERRHPLTWYETLYRDMATLCDGLNVGPDFPPTGDGERFRSIAGDAWKATARRR